MAEFYLEIQRVHVVAVLASGGLFLLRGLALFAGSQLAMSVPVRIVGYAIDTVFLTAALMLATIVRQYPFAHDWLTVKLLLLGVYIALGVAAFRKARSLSVRAGLWFGAIAVYAFIYSVARTHHPLGVFHQLVS
ncbi:SirB2 family protein [Saccharospirillum salsuginis]|uniref:Regulator SirB n=1 Tax=Saccharospirillum salsuginis TaxID=418750 RepID=A0A918KE63_9GAMM|nr:SirB2 family protein [Saccharospirillum salsuginis]GGX59780.1 hypothetical protein GCM10007392_29710 [Saccharospirillum salsuginis]